MLSPELEKTYKILNIEVDLVEKAMTDMALKNRKKNYLIYIKEAKEAKESLRKYYEI